MDEAYKTLQRIIWPRISIGAPESLYFRAHPREAWYLRRSEGMHYVPEAATGGIHTLEFSTFFGAFSLSTWCGPAGIDKITLDIRFTGKALLRIWRDNGHEPRVLLLEELIDSGGGNRLVSIDGLYGEQGILYPQFEVRNSDFQLMGVRYLTPEPPQTEPRLAIIMPTFKRENYVRRNIDLLGQDVLKRYAGQIELFVIDNGRTLSLEAPSGARIIPNRNHGGAGGFARGVLEVTQAKPAFSHVVFCDDDVLIEPESILRLFALLAYLDGKSVVGGGMLKMSNKNILHECGGFTRGMYYFRRKPDADLGEISEVIEYDRRDAANYFAWWLFATPLKAFDEVGYPMPFFVRGDDQEFGKRLVDNQWKMVSLTGCAVWHEEFEKKYSSAMEYYIQRNLLITTWIRNEATLLEILPRIVLRIARALLTYRYERAEFMLQAVEDALKGPAFLTEIDAARFHAELSRKQKSVMRPVEPMEFVAEKYYPNIKGIWWRRILVLLTWNGHLLPKVLMLSDKTPFSKGWAIENLHSARLSPIFRCPSVLYYEPTLRQGMVCRMDRARFFALSLRLLKAAFGLFKKNRSMVEVWGKSHSDMIIPSFWRRHLECREEFSEPPEAFVKSATS
jgi:galactofuranosylgalactofuranosylrhamnosyl-N-acetylglucosaminyl-diphospho-decaprenol beta-1,5/1,6-galactofuranosyltransferase